MQSFLYENLIPLVEGWTWQSAQNGTRKAYSHEASERRKVKEQEFRDKGKYDTRGDEQEQSAQVLLQPLSEVQGRRKEEAI